MRVHPIGLIVFGLIVLLVFLVGPGRGVAVVRGAGIVFVMAVLVEIVVNMFRHRDLRVRSRLLELLGSQVNFLSGSRKS